MIELIFAMTKEGGIGLGDTIPWYDPVELSIFRNKTMGNVIIIGSKTYINIPELYNRFITVVSSQKRDDVPTFSTIEDAISYNTKIYPDKKIFIVGGAMLYHSVISLFSHIITKVHMSIMHDKYECDTFVSFDNSCYETVSSQTFHAFTHLELVPKNEGEIQYLNLLKKVYNNGTTTVGRNGSVKNMFNNHLKFDLRRGFPLLTTKKMFIRGIIEELLFFLRGDTNSSLLEKKNVNIWKGNTSTEFLEQMGLDYPEGLMGPMYGYQWRYFGAIYDRMTGKNLSNGVDQLTKVIESIKTSPTSRRHLMTDFNPIQVDDGVLYPCHSIIIQFSVEDSHIDMFCYNRSSDLFLGLPFNIASSALLLMVVAKLTNLTPRDLNITLGDCHIYDQHVDAVRTQLERVPKKFPLIRIRDFSTVEELTPEHFELSEYVFHSAIKAVMVC